MSSRGRVTLPGVRFYLYSSVAIYKEKMGEFGMEVDYAMLVINTRELRQTGRRYRP